MKSPTNDNFTELKAAYPNTLQAEQFPTCVSPMLATLTEEYFDDPDWIYERKLDGERALVFINNGTVTLCSRNGNRINASYPEVVAALEVMRLPNLVADGEIVAFAGNLTSFAKLQPRMHVSDPRAAKATGTAVYYYLFDLVHCRGYDTSSLPLTKRKQLLKATVPWNHRIRYTTHRRQYGCAFYREACEKGWEGVIAKDSTHAYVAGRSTAWQKFKCVAGQELVIGGYTDPEGERSGFGALLVGYYEDGELRYAGKVGTGYDEELLRTLHDKLSTLEQRESPFADAVDEHNVHFVAPTLVAEIGFTEWTKHHKLRHPRFQGLRRDKDPKTVTRETL